MNRRPGKINHKRRLTETQKIRQKKEKRADRAALPRIEIAPGIVMIDENFGMKPIKSMPDGDPYGLTL